MSDYAKCFMQCLDCSERPKAFSNGYEKGYRKGKKDAFMALGKCKAVFKTDEFWIVDKTFFEQHDSQVKADAIEEYRRRLVNTFEPVEEHEEMELEVVIEDVNRLAKVLKEQNDGT